MMLSKAKIKYIRSLERKKQRQRYDKFVAEGTKIVDEMLRHPLLSIELLLATPQWLENNEVNLDLISIIEVSKKELNSLSSLNTANDVLVVATPLSKPFDNEVISNDISLYLDAIQDPGNLGTILRIADWFGIQHVFLGEGTVDLYNPKVIQSSMGAFLRVNTIAINQEEFWKSYNHVPVFGADLKGEDIFLLPPEKKKGIIVIGNEGNGISSEMRTRINNWITIPSNGGAESLNAAVATGIICASFRH